MAPPRLAPPPVAPVAHGWTEHKAPDGRLYFYNSITRVSTYEKPAELKTPQEKAAAVAAAAASAAARAAPVVIAAAATGPTTARASSSAPAATPTSATTVVTGAATTAAATATASAASAAAEAASAAAAATAAATAAAAAAATPAAAPAAAAPVAVVPPVTAKPEAPAVPVVIPKCKWKAYDGPGGRKYYSDGKASLWDKPKELKEYEAAVAAVAAAGKLKAAQPTAAAPEETATASPVAAMGGGGGAAAAGSSRTRATGDAPDTTTPATSAEPEVEPEPVVELVGFGGANGVALKFVETPSSPVKAASPAQTNGSGGGGGGSAKTKGKKKASAVKVEYNTEEEKKEAFVEMLKEFEVTSTTKVCLCAVAGVGSWGGVVAQVAACASFDSRGCVFPCVYFCGGARLNVTPLATNPRFSHLTSFTWH